MTTTTDSAAVMPLPNVGSIWLARDGRQMRVDEVVIPTLETPWCKMTVLNADRCGKGTRRKTTMNVASFGTGFLRPVAIPSPTEKQPKER